MLLGLGGLPRTALACESHVPALVLGVLERCVVVFQNNLGEDAVFASSFPLGKRKEGGGGVGGEVEVFLDNFQEAETSSLFPDNQIPFETLRRLLRQISKSNLFCFPMCLNNVSP